MTSTSSGSGGKIIQVHFGGGTRGARGKTGARKRGRLGSGGDAHEPQPPEPIEPTRDVYTRAEVQKLLGTTERRLRALEKGGLVVPSAASGRRKAYTFGDLIALRAAIGLLTKGHRVRDVQRAIESLRRALPRVTRPLQELKISSDGAKMTVRAAEGTFEPSTGQMMLDFEVGALREDVVRVLRPAVKQHRARAAFEIYKKASELDEDPRTMAEAAKLYRQAIETDPMLAIAYTNLGNILFRRGDEAAAEALYSKALAIDPGQPEAKYNLGYLMLERHELEAAIRYFHGAIEADPRFADAYFNLAMAYEESGDRKRARPLWRNYLELEPTGTWADIARQHL